ncbi:MAG TPA: PhaM family polyhydroxyalkanoate granule multifunctional regulatory protein [Noviherbaspirillum sp.]|nr:PhaM family polyhydroxyalkanoate granule multifunctional regulatory protein [Noviherbaspirillum sp.]
MMKHNKPSMPNMPNMPNIPGMGAMTDTLEFVKNLWSSMGVPGMSNMPAMNLPGMVMPTLSVDEIHKKISDMKAVESWLTLNMNMLRGTIQALEVQAATIATLQSMGESFSATLGGGATEQASSQSTAAQNGAKAGNGSDETSGTERQHAPAPEPTSKDAADAAALTAPLVNATAWWNMLQDQFKQAVSGAMNTEASVAAPASEKPKAESNANTKAKPKAKTTAPAKTATASSTTTSKKKTSK